MLFDPTQGLVWTAPATLAAGLLGAGLYRLSRSTALLMVAGFLVEWTVHANLFGDWEGGEAWGPRLLLPFLPFLFLPVAALRASPRPLRFAVGVLSAAGLAVNLPPVIVDFKRYYFAVGFGQAPGSWPDLYLWKSLPMVISNGVSGRFPNGRLSVEAGVQGARLVDSIPSLGLPDFWWFFLLYGHVLVGITLMTLLVLVIGLVFTSWLLNHAVREPHGEHAHRNRSLPRYLLQRSTQGGSLPAELLRESGDRAHGPGPDREAAFFRLSNASSERAPDGLAADRLVNAAAEEDSGG
jgi:hypothetical protein